MRYRLRTLLIAAALAPPGLAGAFWLTSTPPGLLKYCFLLFVGTLPLAGLAFLLDALERFRSRR